MEDVEKLLKGTVAELDKLLNARNVLGDPIEKDGATVIPIVSYGFGFGAGGGSDAKSGGGAGTGGGGGIKPVGAIVFDQNGARVEAVKGAASNVAEVLGEAAARIAGEKLSGQGKTDAET
ncbi:MAG: spore germination protein GerW family protein [Thalassovita sp.]|nr:spore germination protein GerW family protein [Thalassovita sp.]